MLISLLVVPLFVLLYLSLQRRRQQLATTYGNFGLALETAGRPLGWRRHVPPPGCRS